jgi:hypothetical protein
MTNTMKAMTIKTIGYVKAIAKIGLANLTYKPHALRAAEKERLCGFSWDKYAQ